LPTAPDTTHLSLRGALPIFGDAGATTYIVRETAAHGINYSVAYAEQLSRLVMASVVAGWLFVVLALTAVSGERYLSLLPLAGWRSEEHTSELQSRENLVCRL